MGQSSTGRQSGSLVRTELKEVTVLFADVVGSTRLIEAMDPERASEALDPVIMTMIEAVRVQGGTVTSIQGDGIMAVFGAPLALEDHAVRACFAALDMLEWHIGRHKNLTEDPIRIRIGLDSGQVLLRMYEAGSINNYDAIGLVVHLANKLQEEAEPDAARISARTERLVRSFVTVEAAGRYRLQSHEYETFRLLGRTPANRKMVRQSRVLCRAVGREQHLHDLEVRAQNLARMNGSSVLIEGEAGVGKSRLIHEFSNSCQEHDFSVLRIEGKPYPQKSNFQPFTAFLAEQLEIGSQDDAAAIDSKLTDLLARYHLGLIDNRLALVSLFNPALDEPQWSKADPEWRRRTVIQAIVDVLAALAREMPLILIAEDAHAMDRGSLEVLQKIAQSARNVAILLVVSQRPGEAIAMPGEDCEQSIRLTPLASTDAHRMCDALLGDDPALTPLKNELVRCTGGVPLFLEELVLDLFETGVIQGEIGEAASGRGRPDVGRIGLPSSIAAILSARMDRLDTPCHDLLRIASVIGEGFPLGLLRTAAHLKGEAFDSRLRQLLESKLIIVTDDAVDSYMMFSHALVQQVCYRSMISHHRRQYHDAVAQAMISYYGNRIHEFTATLAHHYSETGKLEIAITHWQETARRSLMGAANFEAVEALQQAIALVDKLPQYRAISHKKLELMTLLGSALIVAKGPGTEDVAKVYAECRALADTLEESRELFRSLWGQWRIAWRVADKIEIANQLSALAHQSGGDEEQIQAHHAHWVACYNHGALHESLEHISAGLGLCQSGTPSEQLLIYGGHDAAVCGYGEAALCHWILGDQVKGRDLIKRAIRRARQTNHSGSIGHAVDYALFHTQHVGDAQAVLKLADEAIEFARERALPHYETRARAWQGWAMAECGDLLDGIKQMSRAIDNQRRTGKEEDFPVFLEVLAGLQARLGDLDNALGSCDEALEIAAQSGMRHWLAEIHRRRGTVLRDLGPNRHDEAIDAFGKALCLAHEQDARSFESRIITDLAGFPEARDTMPHSTIIDRLLRNLDKTDHSIHVPELRRKIHAGIR